jgi:RNA polymerase sigma factor (sigma-70 family)
MDKRISISDVYDSEITPIYKFFYYKSHNRHVAEDLCSDTFTRFVELAQGQLIEKPRNYLYAIAGRVWLEFLKKKYANPTINPDYLDLITSPHTIERYLTTVETASLKDRSKTLLACVSEKQRMILILHYCENYTLKEVADELGVSVNDIKMNQARAIRKIRDVTDLTTSDKGGAT